MNPTIGYFWRRIRSSLGIRRSTYQRLVQSDTTAPAPPAGTPFAGEAMLRRLCAAPLASRPYYLLQTITAAALTGVFGWAAYAVATDPEPGTWSGLITASLIAMTALGAYHVVGKNYGPAVIEPDRFEKARANLMECGDLDSRPLSLMVTMGVAGLLLVDGAFSGFTLTSTGFASIFSPRTAQWAGCAFSVAMSWMLWHLVKDAAREKVIAQRRATIRNLLRSSKPEDQSAAAGMQRRIGPILGHNYGASSPIRARLLLSAVVLMLATSTFVMRLINEADPAPVSTTAEESSSGSNPNVTVMPFKEMPVQRLE